MKYAVTGVSGFIGSKDAKYILISILTTRINNIT